MTSETSGGERYCAQCGTRMAAGARFCEACGTGRTGDQVMNFTPTVNVSVAAPQPTARTVSVVSSRHGTNMLLRMVWFLLVGWWLGTLWLAFGLILMCTLIGIPVGLMMLNRLGPVMTLAGSSQRTSVLISEGGGMVVPGVPALRKQRIDPVTLVACAGVAILVLALAGVALASSVVFGLMIGVILSGIVTRARA